MGSARSLDRETLLAVIEDMAQAVRECLAGPRSFAATAWAVRGFKRGDAAKSSRIEPHPGMGSRCLSDGTAASLRVRIHVAPRSHRRRAWPPAATCRTSIIRT